MKTEETIKSLIHRFEQCSQDGTGYFDAELSPEECEVVVAALSELSVIDQIRRQRDTAIRQLADLRYGRDGDAISRQTAIRAITSHDGVVDKSVAKRILVQLPSAQPSPIWHSIEEPPSDDRKVLVSFANFSQPMIGRFEGNPDDGYTAYIGDEDETFVENDLFVDGWWELPKKPEGE